MADIIKIDSNTWRIEDGFVRFFLLEGDEKAVLIDSGVNCPDAAELAKTLTDKPVILVNTHGDGDHTSGTGGFSEIYMHADDYIKCEVNIRYPGVILKSLNDGDIIELGNRTLKLIHIPGHTYGSIAVLDIQKRILYAGDSVQKGHIFMFGDKRDTKSYGASLSKLIALKDEYDYIFASHDEYCVPGDYAAKVKEAWEKVQSGELEYEITDMFGNKVKTYTTDVCGFYVD